MKQLGLLDLLILVKKLNPRTHSLNKMVPCWPSTEAVSPSSIIGGAFYAPLGVFFSFFVPTSIVALLHLILCYLIGILEYFYI